MKRKLTGVLLSLAILFSFVTPSPADQVWGDAVDANTAEHDQSITLNVNIGDTWSTFVTVRVIDQGKEVGFPVSGNVAAPSGVNINSDWNVNGYTSPDKLAVSKTENVAGTFSYRIAFAATAAGKDFGNLSKTSDVIDIIVIVSNPVPVEPALSIRAPGSITAEAEAVNTAVDLGSAVSNYPDAVITNNAPAAFPLGTTVVTWSAARNGETVTDDQSVTIVDTTKPTIDVPDDLTKEATAVLTPVDIGNAKAIDIFLKDVTNDAPDAFPLGSTIVTWTAEDASGNTAAATQVVTIVDTTPPVLAAPADKVFIVGQPINLGVPAAADIFLVSVTNDAPALFPMGTTLVTWTAMDSSGNASTATQKITVKYAFGGILQPINGDGSSLFKAGSTVPVKFQLKDANNNNISTATASLKYAKISIGAIGSDVEAVSTAASTSGSLFRYDASSGQYIFNLSTKGLAAGTYRLTVTLDDGMAYSVQISLK